MIHEEKQTFDHNLIKLVSDPEVNRVKKRLCFDQRWLQWREITEVVENGWQQEQAGTRIFQVCSKIKSYRLTLLKWSKGLMTNSGKQIQKLKLEMEELNRQRENRDWQTWDRLKMTLHGAYKE